MENQEFNSLKELKKILPSDIEKIKSEMVDELYADPTIKQFISENNLDSSFVYNNIVSLMDMKEANKNCLKCEGYLKCKNVPDGFKQVLSLTEEDRLDFIKCDKLNEIYPIMSRYLERDFPDAWLYNNISTLSNISISNTLKAKLINIVKNPTKGLYLYGSTGTGKTYILIGLVNSLIDTYKFNARFTSFKSFLDDLKGNFDDPGYNKNRIEELKNVDVLILDDLGAEKVSEWSVQDVLYEIISDRLTKRKLTFFTSMYSLKDLLRIYGGNNPKVERVINIISSLTDEEHLEGINYNKF